MKVHSLKIEELRDLINKGQAKDPLVFLESVMNGQDPREFSGIYKLICEIDSFSDGNISNSDWNEIVDYVSRRFKYDTVPMSDSMNAAKTLAEYLHAKRKQIENINGNSSEDPNNSPLTEEEIILFKEKFNDEF